MLCRVAARVLSSKEGRDADARRQGQIVDGDDEAWNDTGDLRVHILVPNTSLGVGLVTGFGLVAQDTMIQW